MKRARLALVFAGSDPSGGAGLELDLKVLALFGAHGAAVATCFTLQTATGVRAIEAAPAARARRQIEQLARDADLGAVQIGMLPDGAWVRLVARRLESWPKVPVVHDPVLQPTIGPRALPRSGLEVLRRELLPRVQLLTPNAVEAAALLGVSLRRIARDPDAAARALLELGPQAVLLKGGHLPRGASVVDRLRGRHGERDFVVERARGVAPRGTGCALAAAITAGLLHGRSLLQSIELAKSWLVRARRDATFVGRGRPHLGLVAPV